MGGVFALNSVSVEETPAGCSELEMPTGNDLWL